MSAVGMSHESRLHKKIEKKETQQQQQQQEQQLLNK